MKVRVKLRFRGRQKAHTEFGFAVVNRFVKEAAAWGQADSPPKMLGDRDLNVVLSPLPRNKRAKHPQHAEMPEPANPLVPPEPPELPSAADSGS
jgi:translation initiation factor IF-3